MKLSRAVGAVAVLAVAGGGLVAQGAEARPHRTGVPFATMKEFVAENGVAAVQDLNPDLSQSEISTMVDDSTVHITQDGIVVYVEKPLRELAPLATTIPENHAEIPLADFNVLNSKPGSARTIFLDFDGHVVPAGTAWDSNFYGYGGNPLIEGTYPAFTIDGSYSFSDEEKQIIIDTWASVAEDYAPFDVNVTTEDPGDDAINRTSNSDQVYGTRALITGGTLSWNPDTCGCGGIAMRGVFNLSISDGEEHEAFQPAFVFAGQGYDGKIISDIASHEVGHNLGLSHDGLGRKSAFSPNAGFSAPSCRGGTHKDNIEYFMGLSYKWWVGSSGEWATWSSGNPPCHYTGNSNVDVWDAVPTSVPVLDNWAPIMGAGYYKGITQWSKGDAPYPSPASNTENDLTVMQQYGIARETDELTETPPFAPTESNTLSNAPFDGIITTPTDTDFLSVSVTDGTLGVSITSPSPLPDLDAQLSLFDSKGKGVFSVNPASSDYSDWRSTATVEGMGALLNVDLPNGTYYIRIDGVGKSGSYSDFGSVGSYTVSKVAVTASSIPTTSKPTISGVRKLGYTLTAKYGTWSSGVTFKKQWLRDGVVISGTNSKSYTLTRSDVGHKISFRLIGSKTNKRTAIKVSSKTTTITR